jgi:hypothetical protein
MTGLRLELKVAGQARGRLQPGLNMAIEVIAFVSM